ncbi:MAG: SDR family oxidoreductase [Dehalococcoidales bacterium]|nr:SDR family oxidoreductase [Dehalococcoidales bacterium]
MSKKVIVLGGSGMLGSMVADSLSRNKGLNVAATVRTQELAGKCRERLPGVNWVIFDGGSPDVETRLDVIRGNDWVINAIGITKPLIHDNNPAEVERAVLINSLLPHQIARQAQKHGVRVLQIATDCVFSGNKGSYIETDAHDALDAYGKTKSLGEVNYPQINHLRCSIIGPEPKEHKFLLDWFVRQPKNASVNGYTNHRWNGVTTLNFARVCEGIIIRDISLSHLQHIVPGGEVTKCDMLGEFARSFHREDVDIKPAQAAAVIDRTLKTSNEPLNKALWAAAGYSNPPTVPQMIAEMAAFDFKLGGL